MKELWRLAGHACSASIYMLHTLDSYLMTAAADAPRRAGPSAMSWLLRA